MRYHTVAGFVLQQMEHLPNTGEYLYWNDIRFEVADMDGQRIDKLWVTLPLESEKDNEATDETDTDING